MLLIEGSLKVSRPSIREHLISARIYQRLIKLIQKSKTISTFLVQMTMKTSIVSRTPLTPLLAALSSQTLTKSSTRETAILRWRTSGQVTIYCLLMTSLLDFNSSILVILSQMKRLCLSVTRAHNLSQWLQELEILTTCYWWALIHSSNMRSKSIKISSHSYLNLIQTTWQIWYQTECLQFFKQIHIWWHLK